MIEKDITYYEGNRQDMFGFVPHTVKKTIEFGCSSGKFSASIKNAYQTEAWGVDMDPDSVNKASKVLDKVVLGEAFEALKNLPENYFDCVICNDFLEHIQEPALFLQALRPYVREKAYLVCSLPNVRYWKNMSELMFEKDWRYRDAGILDSTHLRFFTQKSMVRLMKENNLDIIKMEGINPTKSVRFHIPNFLTFGWLNDMKFMQFGICAHFNK